MDRENAQGRMTWPWAVPLALVVAVCLTLFMEGQSMSYTQPVCNDCWDKQHPDKPSPRRNQGTMEVCCYCGLDTVSGIYVRVDPKTVPYPTGD